MNQSRDRNGYPRFGNLLGRRAQAWATMRGSEKYPRLRGMVRFYQTEFGVVTVAEFMGLPDTENVCTSPIYALHIHEGGTCTGNVSDAFAGAGMHYNPDGCPHPYHAGDLPPVFGANGYGFSVNLTDRFLLEEVIGRVVVLHASPDDFATQPSGGAGEKMACGVIRA